MIYFILTSVIFVLYWELRSCKEDVNTPRDDPEDIVDSKVVVHEYLYDPRSLFASLRDELLHIQNQKINKDEKEKDGE